MSLILPFNLIAECKSLLSPSSFLKISVDYQLLERNWGSKGKRWANLKILHWKKLILQTLKSLNSFDFLEFHLSNIRIHLLFRQVLFCLTWPQCFITKQFDLVFGCPFKPFSTILEVTTNTQGTQRSNSKPPFFTLCPRFSNLNYLDWDSSNSFSLILATNKIKDFDISKEGLIKEKLDYFRDFSL